MAEFSCYLAILVAFGLILIDLAAIPLRLGQLDSTLAQRVHQMTMEDRLSKSRKEIDNNFQLNQTQTSIEGVHIEDANLTILAISRQGDQTISLDPHKPIPSAWLPDGTNCPCTYQLNLKVHAKIDPLAIVPIAGRNVPGLSAPVEFAVDQSSNWENLGRDPYTGQFYINE
jgi:hypothetical protein